MSRVYTRPVRLGFLLVAWGLFTTQLFGQDPDSTTVVSDSLIVDALPVDTSNVSSVTDSVAVVDSTLFNLAESFARDKTFISYTHPGVEVEDALRWVPGSYQADLSTPGWPSSWTIRNRPLNSVDVSWDGLLFDELFTGRPAFELLPRGLVTSSILPAGTFTSPILRSEMREMIPGGAGPPLTELAYRSSNKGLQYAYATHSQSRVQRIFGRPVRIQLTAGYLGEKADGEYSGSKLERARNFLGMLRFSGAQRGRFAFEISDMSNRRRVGAHGGVIPPVPSDPSSIYQRFGAFARDGSAERRTKRNDLTGKLAYRGDRVWVDWTSRRTSQFLRARSNPDTIAVNSTRYTTQLDVTSFRGPVLFGLRGSASTESFDERAFETYTGSRSLARYSAAGNVSMRLSSLMQTTIDAGINSVGGQTSYEGAFVFSTDEERRLSLEIAASRGVPDRPLVNRVGFGRFATIASSYNLGYVSDASARLSGRVLGVSLDITAFGVIGENQRDWFATSNVDSISYRTVGDDVATLGTTVQLGFRKGATRGFYLFAVATTLAVSSPENPDPGNVFPGEIGPHEYASATTGLRYLLFRGDLDGNFALRARAWPDHIGRVFHRQTGLMVIPETAANNIDASVVLDLVIEAGIRGATVYVTYENLLSGTNVVIGNQNVPGYPLAQRRLRFGVYWPITN